MNVNRRSGVTPIILDRPQILPAASLSASTPPPMALLATALQDYTIGQVVKKHQQAEDPKKHYRQILPNRSPEEKSPMKKSKKTIEIECYKCQFCPILTLTREMMVLHSNRNGSCASEVVKIHCPGCPNVFGTNLSLKTHLSRDHNMLEKDVKCVLKNLSAIKMFYLGDNESENCVRVERSSCANVNKRSSLLESYLDDINDRSNGLPARLTRNGEDILENTFK